MRGPAIMALVCVVLSGNLQARGPWRAGEDNTAGWQLMSPQERIEHQARLREFTEYGECRRYLDAHHAEMVERARRLGLALPRARRDACAHLLPAQERAP